MTESEAPAAPAALDPAVQARVDAARWIVQYFNDTLANMPASLRQAVANEAGKNLALAGVIALAGLLPSPPAAPESK